MSGKFIPLLSILLLNAVFPVFSADDKPTVRQPEQVQSAIPEKKSHYFQDSASEMDNLVDRVRFKISYSWSKSAEYFRLACSSVTDSLPAKGRDIKAHAESKKEELIEKSRKAVRETTEQTMKDISRKGEEIKQDLNKMGQEIKDETAEEIRKNTDKLLK